MRDISARELKGHNILAVERFWDNTRWMIEFSVLRPSTAYGSPGEEMRLFLTEDGYQAALQSQQRRWHPRPPYRSLQGHGWCSSSPLAKTASWKAAPWLLTTGLHFVKDDCSSQYNHGSVQCEKRPSTSLLPNFGYKKTAILIPKNCGVQHFSNFLA